MKGDSHPMQWISNYTWPIVWDSHDFWCIEAATDLSAPIMDIKESKSGDVMDCDGLVSLSPDII